MNWRDERVREWALAALVALLTMAGHTVAFPFAFSGGDVVSLSEAAYLFLVPLALWLMRPQPLWRTVAVAQAAGWLSWLVLLWWLRHVTLVGTVLLAGLLGLFFTGWALAARWAMPRLRGRNALLRLPGLAGLAAFWVLLEWLRTWVLSGFPWLPLAASQWDRPALLQVLSVTGFMGLSFILVYFNLAVAQYAMGLIRPARGASWFRRLSPELYSALFLLALTIMLMVPLSRGRARPQPLFEAGFVQPYVPQTMKWSPASAREVLNRLERESGFAMAQGAQVVLWPEAATPGYVVAPNPEIRLWTEQLSKTLGAPLLIGSLAATSKEEPRKYNIYNGIFVVDPQTGLEAGYYSKRKLVPFGEFNPLGFLPFDVTLGMVGETTRGTGPKLLPLSVDGLTLQVGPLVCYEDIFPSLARETTAQGADLLFVATNNAWYGEEAGAYQHAIHSILRAVENRRPVLRSGNGGWSGWIDEYGGLRFIAQRPGKGVYFEGNDVAAITRDPRWTNQLSFYTRYGDWFSALASLLLLGGFLALRYGPTSDDAAPTTPEPVTPRERARELLRQGKFNRRRLGRL